MANHLSSFEIFGEDPEKLAAFYKEVFEWQIEKMEGLGYWRIHTTEAGNALHGGLTYKYLQNLSGWLIYITVDSLDDTIEKIIQNGGAVVRPKTAVPKAGWVTIVTDPANNTFGVWQTDPLAFPMPEPD
jgi:uncharacterized protein